MRSRFCVLLLFLLAVSPATAITLPNFPTVEPEPTAEPTKAPPAPEGYAPLGVAPKATPQPTTAATCSLDSIRACLIHELAVNVDHRYARQDFVARVFDLDGQSSSELNSTALRFEYVPVPFVSVYFLGVHHDGIGKPTGVDLDGWGWGTGITGFFPVFRPFVIKGMITATPFSTTDFNYTDNDFDDIESRVDVYSATQRLAVGFRGKKPDSRLAKWSATIFGGASFQDRPTRQRIRGISEEVRISPDDTWIPVVGVVLSYFGKNEAARPCLSFSIEGGWGDRDQVSLSLRYATDFH